MDGVVGRHTVEQQEKYGAAFRRLAEFMRALRATHDLGRDLVRNSADAVAAALSAVTDEVSALISSGV